MHAGMRTKKRLPKTSKRTNAERVHATSPTKAKPKPPFEVVDSESDSDENSTSGDEELLEDRADTLRAKLNQSMEASQPARDNLAQLRKAVEEAQEEVFAARTIYTEENRKRKAEISSTSQELQAIVDKLERRSKKAKILIAAGLKS
jgi:predicted  nucleic acid-binding Zn-ribbon protein